MVSEQYTIENHKIMSMDAEKRERVLGAAMAEFCKGYKAASTDEIVKRAGISKGLLFHYFGTKKDLYQFICTYALETTKDRFIPLLQARQKDLLERIWQMVLFKRELCRLYPDIFEFLTAVYYQIQDDPNSAFATDFKELQAEIYQMFYQNSDETLLQDGIDRVMATNIIRWTLDGISKQITEEQKPFAQMNEEFDQYIEVTRGYLDLLRRMLYRE